LPAVVDQSVSSKARRAASIAADTSSSVEAVAVATSSPVAGSRLSNVEPLLGTQPPSM
jgi:hypothetical protein